MNILNNVKENFSNPSEKWNQMNNFQRSSMILSLAVGVILLGLVIARKIPKGRDYLTPILSSLGADGFVALIGVLYVLVGGLQWGG